MQIGYNNDVQYRDKTFHIQTEDRGEDSASIETQIFHAGAIFDTSIISYQNVLDETNDKDERTTRIRNAMNANHKSLYKKLLNGDYDEMAGLAPLSDKSVVEVDDLVPSQDRVPASALQAEAGDIEGFEDPGAEFGEAVDLSKIHEKLAAGAALEEESATPTIMLDANAITQPPAEAVRPPIARGSMVPDFSPTGRAAYRGCGPERDTNNIVELVESFLAS